MNETANMPVLDIDPYATENLLDPYPMHERMREAGPVVRLAPYPTVVACARHEQVHAVFNDHATFISGAGVGLTNFNLETPFRPKSLILEADPPLHTQTRAVLSRILSPKAVMQIRATFTAVAEKLVERCVEKGTICGIHDLAQIYPLKVFPDAVGVGDDGRDNLLVYGDLVFNSMGPRNALLARSAERMGPVTEWIMSNCQREHLRPGGFGDQIYQAADAGEITHEQAPLLVRSFLSAGVDTTINGLGNALFALAHHPEQYAKLHADASLARPAFEEALRWESTAQTFYRTAVRDCEIAGVPVAENTKVLCMLAAANRDPRKWPDPDRYDIERRPSGHVAFGAGIHGCVGQAVARLEGEVVLTALARRVKRIEPAGQHTRRLNNTLRALDTLPLRLIPA
ncbi:cytochrome P450 [Piscinibacter defluvii]|uniref:cytochrome P450 n=1 Tax=Piscinibacter defluvii TaxID=1796922 RepID=UPI000FDEE531|nr:cytochrome P450 [Piscinibacter defluvii]